MTEFLRTPDSNFDALTDFPFAPHYHQWQDLRMHYLDEGPADGPVMLLVHGMPSWSYLYRHMIPLLVAAGYRCVVPDHMGFGRSDKPTDIHQIIQQRQSNGCHSADEPVVYTCLVCIHQLWLFNLSKDNGSIESDIRSS